jgi:hypothetical protein
VLLILASGWFEDMMEFGASPREPVKGAPAPEGNASASLALLPAGLGGDASDAPRAKALGASVGEASPALG